MSQKEQDDQWTEKLKALLAEQATRRFNNERPTFKSFADFVEEYTYYAGKDSSFVEEMYRLYLDRINAAGGALQEKINPQQEP